MRSVALWWNSRQQRRVGRHDDDDRTGPGVLIDATIVRAVLVGATMKLLGDAKWYLPRWLEWLPRLEHEASPPAERAPDAAPAAALGA